MSIGMVGRKCGMTRVFLENGDTVPVTVLHLLPNKVTQVKTIESDGYVAVQEFRESPIPLTNAKGAFTTILGEFIGLGVLWHAKYLQRFM